MTSGRSAARACSATRSRLLAHEHHGCGPRWSELVSAFPQHLCGERPLAPRRSRAQMGKVAIAGAIRHGILSNVQPASRSRNFCSPAPCHLRFARSRSPRSAHRRTGLRSIVPDREYCRPRCDCLRSAALDYARQKFVTGGGRCSGPSELRGLWPDVDAAVEEGCRVTSIAASAMGEEPIEHHDMRHDEERDVEGINDGARASGIAESLRAHADDL